MSSISEFCNSNFIKINENTTGNYLCTLRGKLTQEKLWCIAMKMIHKQRDDLFFQKFFVF